MIVKTFLVFNQPSKIFIHASQNLKIVTPKINMHVMVYSLLNISLKVVIFINLSYAVCGLFQVCALMQLPCWLYIYHEQVIVNIHTIATILYMLIAKH